MKQKSNYAAWLIPTLKMKDWQTMKGRVKYISQMEMTRKQEKAYKISGQNGL